MKSSVEVVAAIEKVPDNQPLCDNRPEDFNTAIQEKRAMVTASIPRTIRDRTRKGMDYCTSQMTI